MSENYIPLSSWAEEDKPREKMMAKGISSLSTIELLTVLIRSGSGGENAFDLARRIMSDCNNDLNVLARWGIKDFTNHYKGMGIAKAASVMAAFELARRRVITSGEALPVLTSSRDIFDYLQPRMGDLDHEEFWIVLMNSACRVKVSEKLFAGGIDGLMVDLRLLFRRVLEEKARSLVVAHNHPSGNARPSEKDISLTRRIKEGGRTLDIVLLDHLIVTNSGYYSFADSGML